MIYGEKRSPSIGRGNKSCTRVPFHWERMRVLVTGGSLNPLAPQRECISINVKYSAVDTTSILLPWHENVCTYIKKNHLTCLRMFVFQVLVLGWIGHIWRVIVSVDPH